MTPTQFKKARKDLGLSQEKLGKELGLTRSTINVIENGTDPIDPRTEKAIWCLIYESNPADLVNGHRRKVSA